MFTGNHTAPPKYLGEKIIEGFLDPDRHRRVIIVRNHDIDMNVAVTRMTKGCDRKSMANLQVASKIDQIDQSATGHNNVLVQLR